MPHRLEQGTRVFEDGVRLMADAFGLELDEVAFECELGATTKEVDLGWCRLPEGSVGGAAFRYVGKVAGAPRVELALEWQMTPHTDPKWDVQGCYITHIDGDPVIHSKHMIWPKAGTDLSSPESFAAIGMTVTGMPALNAIRAVVEAPAGMHHERRPTAARLCRSLPGLTDGRLPAPARGPAGSARCSSGTGW